MPVILALAVGMVAALWIKSSFAHSDWQTASRESAGIAPDPSQTKEAVVQVYAARAWSWRGYIGVHTWVSVKPTDASQYTVYEVIGWRARRGLSVVSVSNRPPDGRWFGAMPKVVADMRGDGVDDIIRRIDVAARSYPFADEYRIWPGPNSNTFTAHLARAVPEMKIDLPPTAIGKDYLTGHPLFAATPSGTGYQLSLFGLLGVLAGSEEGLEVNILGLTFGIDPGDLALKLPGFGRLEL
ncbi:MAG: DUF3750 domain-containing protein [Rhodospirillaceae bacterium]|nr:DUF3750 domain-containing protein [Rhodospirillaceae bacterium]